MIEARGRRSTHLHLSIPPSQHISTLTHLHDEVGHRLEVAVHEDDLLLAAAAVGAAAARRALDAAQVQATQPDAAVAPGAIVLDPVARAALLLRLLEAGEERLVVIPAALDDTVGKAWLGLGLGLGLGLPRAGRITKVRAHPRGRFHGGGGAQSLHCGPQQPQTSMRSVWHRQHTSQHRSASGPPDSEHGANTRGSEHEASTRRSADLQAGESRVRMAGQSQSHSGHCSSKTQHVGPKQHNGPKLSALNGGLDCLSPWPSYSVHGHWSGGPSASSSVGRRSYPRRFSMSGVGGDGRRPAREQKLVAFS